MSWTSLKLLWMSETCGDPVELMSLRVAACLYLTSATTENASPAPVHSISQQNPPTVLRHITGDGQHLWTRMCLTERTYQSLPAHIIHTEAHKKCDSNLKTFVFLDFTNVNFLINMYIYII